MTTISSTRVNQERFLEKENTEQIEEDFIDIEKYCLLVFHHTFQ